MFRRKLSIGTSNDPLEVEADRVADQVLRMPMESPAAHSPEYSFRGGGLDERTLFESTETQARLLAQDISPNNKAVGGGEKNNMPPSVAQAVMRGGTELERNLRRDMERRFGRDFSQVRVHADETAMRSAQEVNANAYTIGNDIVFARGRFAPQTRAGLHLLAHELTHVVQQGGKPVPKECLQHEERDPDELAAEAKEDAAIVNLAQRALRDKNRGILAQEVVWRLINNHRFDEHFELSGSRYDAKQKGVSVDFDVKKKVRSQGMIVIGDEALQRVANGRSAAVIKEIQAQIGGVDAARGTVDYVFIMGADAPKSGNKFYTEAIKYFKAEHAGARMVENVRTLDDINKTVNAEGKPVRNLIIVSHAHPDGTLQFSLDAGDKTPRQVQYSELKEANRKGALTQPKADLVGFWTNVSIRGCNLGRSSDMLDEVQAAFGGNARVIAPTHGQRYGGGKQSLAGPYFEVPGVSKLSDDEAFKRIKAKSEYAFITDWDAMRSTMLRNVEDAVENVYDGPFPEAGGEMALLVRTKGKAFARDYKFGSSSASGGVTSFVFAANDKFKKGDVTIDMPTPPSERQAIDLARVKVANPDTYEFKFVRTRKGLDLRIDVRIQKTEWELHHAEIKKGGKGFNPTQGTKPWFGDTQ